jgi:hypothetical protein
MVIRSDRGFVWTPRESYRVAGSILINGVEVKLKVVESSITMAVIGVTAKAGSCELIINNSDGAYTGLFSKKDSVKIYADFASGTTQQFDGFVREVNPTIDGYPKLQIIGNDWAGEALMRVVNKQYSTPMTLDAIFKDLVADYLPGHTTNNVADLSSFGTFTPTFNNKKLIDCFKDLMDKTQNNYCAYCDFSKDWHVFEKGSIFNLYEPIIHTRNLISLSTEDTLSDMATKITLYGKDQENMPMMVTVSNDPEGVGTIHNVYRDTNITTYASLLSKANDILAKSSTSEIKGKEAVVKGMITLRPGDSVYMFAPLIGLQTEVFVPEFRHTIIGGKVMKTYVTWQLQHKMPETISTVIKDTINASQEMLNIDNPDDLENSYNFIFDDNSNVETITGLSITGGKLQISAGGTTGTLITSTREVAANITKIELKYDGWNLGDSTFEVSVDGGLNYETVTRNTVMTPSYSGSSLKLRTVLNSTAANASPNIESMALLYT